VDENALNQLVVAAQSGDLRSLEQLVREIQDDVYDLALRMLGEAEDARDASQEALVRVDPAA